MIKKYTTLLFVTEWLAYFSAIYYFVGGSIWLDVFLSGAIVSISALRRQVQHHKKLYDITDAHLVAVSAQVVELEQSIEASQAKFTELENRL